MDVYVTSPPAGNPPSLLAGRFHPMAGTFALHIGPAEVIRSKRTRKTVAIPFFHALRKDLGLSGSYTGTTNNFRAYIPVWFAAHNAQELVVFNGKVLYPATMASIFEYGATVPHVTFVSEPGDLTATVSAIRETGVEPTVLNWDTLLQRLPLIPDTPPAPEPEYTLDHLPVCDFLVFLARARKLNTSKRFEPILRDYEAAYRAARDIAIPSLDALVVLLAELSRTATNTAQMLVHLRAAQTALLTRGWYLSAHQDKTMGMLSAVKPPTPTDNNWNALLGYVPTRRPAIATLYLLDIPREKLPSVTLGNVDDWLNAGCIRNVVIPEKAATILRAHLLLRRNEGGNPGDPYFGGASLTALAEDLTLARRHLSIPIDGRVLRKELAHSVRPLDRIGLDLRSMT